MTSIIREINNYYLANPQEYAVKYSNQFDALYNELKRFQGVKSDLKFTDFQTQRDQISFSVIFSDVTSLYPEGMGIGGSMFHQPQQKRAVSVPKELHDKIFSGSGVPAVHGVYYFRESEQDAGFIKEVEPLLLSERLVIHPARLLMWCKDTRKEGVREWKMEDVNIDSPDKKWDIVNNANDFGSLPLQFTPSTLSNTNDLFEITVPYFENLDFKTLNKLIDDNYLLLQSFRTSLNVALIEAKNNGKNIIEIKNDVIRPSVEKIEREFGKLSEQHSLKVAGAVLATVSVTLASVATGGIIPAAAGVLGGIAGIVKLDSDYKDKLETIETKPLYLLWKMKQASQRR